MLGDDDWLQFSEAGFTIPAYRVIHEAIRAAGNAADAPAQWLREVRAQVPDALAGLLSELAVTPLPATNEDTLRNYCLDIMRGLFSMQITRRKAEKMGALQRMDSAADPQGYQQLQRELMELEIRRRQLRGD
jgi:DNA primase